MGATLRGLAALSLILVVGCNVTTAPLPRGTLPATARPLITPPPPPTDLPAEVALPRIPIPNTVYDLGACTGDVPGAAPGSYLILAYVFTTASKPIAGAAVSGEGFTTAKTDAKGVVQLRVPVGTAAVTIRSGEASLASPVKAKTGECRVLVAYFG